MSLKLSDKHKARTALVLSYLCGQGSTQLLSVLTSMAILRMLSIEEYAKYSVALAFQAIAISISNLGLSDSIVPLVGSRVGDARVVGEYVRAAISLRNRIFVVLAPISFAAFFVIAEGHKWGLVDQCLLGASIVVAVFGSLNFSCYAAPLIIRKEITTYFLAMSVPNSTRLLVLLALFPLKMLSAVVASWLGAIAQLASAAIVWRRSRRYIQVSGIVSASTRREVAKTVMPMVPAAIFAAFQPQIALLIASGFGQSLQIAQVSALSKIPQFLAVFNSFASLVIGPYVARLPAEQLKKTVLEIMMGVFAISAIFVIVGFFLPWIVTAVLGANYRDLESIVGWVVLAAVASSAANVIWVINRARRWLFWRGSTLEIGCLIAFQAFVAAVVGVETTRDLAFFMLAAGVAHLVAHGSMLAYGFSRHHLRAGSANVR